MNNCSTVFYDLKNAYDTSIYILRLELQELLAIQAYARIYI